jgi:hypothetical protein
MIIILEALAGMGLALLLVWFLLIAIGLGAMVDHKNSEDE